MLRLIRYVFYFFSCACIVLFNTPLLHARQNILKFDRIGLEQGLSDNVVNCMLQDRQGFIWFGTRDGLNRYDGYTFIVYRPDFRNPGSISDVAVECILEDREGRLWMGMLDGGLNRFDKGSGRFTRFMHNPGNPNSITKGAVISICEQERYIWAVIRDADVRLCKIDKETGRTTRYEHIPTDPFSISSNKVSSVICTPSGTLWVATDDGGLNRFDPARDGFINKNYNPLYAKKFTGQIRRMYSDGERLYLWGYTALRWLTPGTPDGSGEKMDSLHHPGIETLYAVYRDRSGMLWMGGASGGIGLQKRGEQKLVNVKHNGYDPYSLGSNRVFSIIEDKSGNIWLGTDNGVSKFNRRNLHPSYYQYTLFDSSSISGRVVRNILKDRKGNLWIAMENGGVNRFDASTDAITRFNCDPRNPFTLSHPTANFLFEDSGGDMWVGTNEGLSRFEQRTGRFRRYPYGSRDEEHIPGPNVWSILEGLPAEIWIGTFNGLCSLDRATHRIKHCARYPNGPIDDRILSLHKDRAGNIWVGTDKGLSVFNREKKSWKHYEHRFSDTSGLSNNRVWYIHEDSVGIFWLATSGGGLNKLDPCTGKIRHYTERDGLAGNIVYSILEDNRHRLWISTSKGLSMLNPMTNKIRNYSLQDGFYIPEFHFKSCYKDKSGYMYFGGTNGIIVFHPDSLTSNQHVPHIMLTSFKVFNHETIFHLNPLEEIRLTHDSNFFSFSFAALDFTNSRRNRYWYRLEGLDAHWREANGMPPRADYTNVPPGEYIFHVQGSNSDGVRNEKGISVEVNIIPAYWQTWWFRGTIILLSLALVAGIIGGRIRGIRRRGELERKLVEYQLKALRAQMNPHFIFNSLNSILLFMFDHDIDAAHLYLTKFSRLMRSTLEHSKSESVPLAEELEALAWYLDLEALRLDNSFTYTINVAPEINIGEVLIPPMLIQPYAENAIKHGLKAVGPGGVLSIDIRLEGEWIICSITDNGVGRKKADKETSVGRIHRSRGMEVTKERLEILSSLGRQCYGLDVMDLTGDEGIPLGTRVDIRIPTSPDLHHTRKQQGVHI